MAFKQVVYAEAGAKLNLRLPGKWMESWFSG